MRRTPSSSPSAGARELLSLQATAQEVAGELKVVPGARWGYFYLDGTPLSWAEKILAGDCEPIEAAAKMRPKALVYDQSLLADPDAKTYILPTIRASAHFVAHANFERLARLVVVCKEKELSARQILRLSDSLSENALYAHALRMYGSTGARDIRTIAANRADLIAEEIANLVGLDKVVKVLQLQSLVQDLRCGSPILLEVTKSLAPAEQAMVERLTPYFRRFTEHNDELTWQELIKPILDTIPAKRKSAVEEQGDLEQFEQQITDADEYESVSPEDRGDYENHGPLPEPDISEAEQTEGEELQSQPEQREIDQPPDQSEPEEERDVDAHNERDDYTPPPSPPEPEGGLKEQNEKEPEFVRFRVTAKEANVAPLGGYYIDGRHSYYDRQEKNWAKRKQLGAYQASSLDTKRYVLSGDLKVGLTAIPLPQGYGIVPSSVPGVSFFQDQYGCVYAQTDKPVHCNLEFGKLVSAVELSPPIDADLEQLYLGMYETKIEQFLRTVQGDNISKAARLAQWIKSHKSYPKDLKAALALQAKLRAQSTPENYLPTLAASAQLECYSSATLFVDWCRRLQVPARLVIGENIQQAKGNKCLISNKTRHAWAEVWSGKEWVRIDATPPKPKEDDKDDINGGESGQPGEQKEDASPMDTPEGESTVEVSSEPSLPDQLQERQDVQAEQMAQEISQQEMDSADQQMKQLQEAVQQAQSEKHALEKQIDQSKSFKELEQKKNSIDQNDKLFEEMKDELEKRAEQKKEEMKDDLEKHLDKLEEEGFIEEDVSRSLKEQLEREENENNLDRLADKIKEQSQLEEEYERLVDEVSPLVDAWYDHFLEVLPKRQDPEFDEDSLARSSHLDRRALKRPRTLITGLMRNPLRINESLIPKFIASIVVDVSGSMAGEKLAIARKVLVFFCELFSRIAKSHDYLKFAINIFSDSMTTIKDYDQEYNENTFYDYAGGIRTTVKARIMKAIQTQGGTNMLDALKAAVEALSAAVDGDREYASALYLLGDGGDTCGNQERIRQLVSPEGRDNTGEHMYAAMVLGSEGDRQILAQLFGDDRTAVANTFEGQIEIAMLQFMRDITGYLEEKR